MKTTINIKEPGAASEMCRLKAEIFQELKTEMS